MPLLEHDAFAMPTPIFDRAQPIAFHGVGGEETRAKALGA